MFSSCDLKPERKVGFTWATDVTTATLADLEAKLCEEYFDSENPYKSTPETFVYAGHSVPVFVKDDDTLHSVLKVCGANFKNRLTISLENHSKGFSDWKFGQVCQMYGLSFSPNLDLMGLLPEFDEIEAAPLNTESRKAFQSLVTEVEAKTQALQLIGSNEATRSLAVASFLVWTTGLFQANMLLACEKTLVGRRGKGSVDYSVHARKNPDFTLSVTEVKKEDFKQRVGQNIVQLDSALSAKKRKRSAYDVGDDEAQNLKSYGIVTDAKEWWFLECTMDVDEQVSLRISKLCDELNFSSNWQDNAKAIFQKLIWLFSRIQEQILVHDRRNKTNLNKRSKAVASSPPASSASASSASTEKV
ncbi:hypothetical protein BGZ80_009518 [Entomortierella chlamydospora]|uniref:Uncharacterized protein n=1 Tax=Entomortierella chlamydospora TaxID=101097 RepID=A0A9P6T0E0_9FUNG|nr:hypothetical protein BGZ80_009518 [Entomortierella chlamydospora]